MYQQHLLDEKDARIEKLLEENAILRKLHTDYQTHVISLQEKITKLEKDTPVIREHIAQLTSRIKSHTSSSDTDILYKRISLLEDQLRELDEHRKYALDLTKGFDASQYWLKWIMTIPPKKEYRALIIKCVCYLMRIIYKDHQYDISIDWNPTHDTRKLYEMICEFNILPLIEAEVDEVGADDLYKLYDDQKSTIDRIKRILDKQDSTDA